jgi:hypothetical protein
MGKATRMMITFGDLLEILQGGFLFYDESQLSAVKSALVNFQQKNDTKGVVVGFLIYSSGKVCLVMEKSPLIPTDKMDSCQFRSFTFITRRLPLEYSTNSWQYPLLAGMCQHNRTRFWLKVYFLWSTITAFG